MVADKLLSGIRVLLMLDAFLPATAGLMLVVPRAVPKLSSGMILG